MSRKHATDQISNVHPYSCIYDALADWAVRTPDAPAILAPGRAPLTYGRLRRHIEETLRELLTMGVGNHDRVVVVLPHGPEMAVACLTLASRMICAPLNVAYSAEEFAFYLEALRPQALLIQYGMDSPVRDVAQDYGIRVIELVTRPDARAGLFTLVCRDSKPIMSGMLAASDNMAAADNVAFLLQTSGTTSRSKVVVLTHANVCTAAHYLIAALALTTRDRCLNVLPLFNSYGLLAATLASIVAGSSTVFPPGFDVTQFFTWLDEFRPTWYQAVPAMQREILSHLNQQREIIARAPLRFIRTGSAPLAAAVQRELENAFQVPIIEGWGMVEASGTVTCNAPISRSQKVGSVGPTIGPEIAILDETGRTLPAGESGEIVVRGATVMSGYENDPEANKTAFIHGWFRTGDTGYIDDEGYLFLTGRIKEIINRGGEKITPQEVEDVLMTHPAVAQTAVFAIPHPRLGEDVAAAVVMSESTRTCERELRLFVAERLTDTKVPRRVYFVSELPKTSTGKVQRLGLAEKLNLIDSSTARLTRPHTHIEPRTQTEKTLIELWSHVFSLDDVGAEDDFFLLGGDSLLAMRLMARIWAIWQIKLSFRTLFESPKVADMAKNIDMATQAASNRQNVSIQDVSINRSSPLSYAQQRLWFLEQLDPGRAAYNLPFALRFNGDLQPHLLERSLNAIFQRHDILRTTFSSVDGQPVQIIHPSFPFSLPIVDLQSMPTAAREVAIQRLTAKEILRPFDLVAGPLLRETLLRLGRDHYVLLLILHHIIFDGWSAEIFTKELASIYTALYNGQSISLPALPIQYADFAIWQRQRFQEIEMEVQLAYWKQQLGDSCPILELPSDRPRPLIQTSHGACQSLSLSQHLSAALKILSQQEGVTLFMTLLAVFKILLYRYTGQEDLSVGTPIAGRTRVETEGLIGFFVNTLVLRTHVRGELRFRAFLRRVREVTLGAFDHQDLPFDKLVEMLQPERELSRNPLFQVMFALQNASLPTLKLPSLTMSPQTINGISAKFDLMLSMCDTDQGLKGTLEYNTDLFDASTIERMLGHFHTLLDSIVAHPEYRLAELSLLTAAERDQLIIARNDTLAYERQAVCIHERFETEVERTPHAVALICDGKQLTYAALNQRANQLAHHLQTLGVGPEVSVGLCIDRSLDMIVGVLGILKAGGVYVPIDPAYPQERLTFMLANTQIRVVVTQRQFTGRLHAHGACLVCLDIPSENMARQSDDNPVSGVQPENLAYVIYTSGSTGAAKGVMVEHRQVMALLHGFEHVAPGGDPRVGTAVCPFSFDVAVWEFFSMLCFGGTLHIIPKDILADPEHFVRYLLGHHITSAYIPPALLSDIAIQLEQQRHPMMLNRILSGVEPIKQGVFQRFRHLSKSMCIVNGYGPTETTICATLFLFDTAADSDRPTPIGTQICGYEIYLVDANLQPVPIGIPGELLIGGAGLSRGYHHRPGLTAENFIPHPFSNQPGARLYKTGDVARYLPDGTLRFLGRLDQQIKIRGYRIEPQEIEAVLCQHPGVRETVVMAREMVGFSNKRLVAYLVANAGAAPSSLALRRFLKQKLPEYMIPSAFVMLEALPLTPSGKLDRQALPAPDMTSDPFTAPFTVPRTATEKILAGIWAEVLSRKQISVHDNFFDLGGDSILSIQIIARANQAGLRLTTKQLFQQQTIAELALVAGRAPAVQVAQGIVTGPVPLTPIQKWFFEQTFSNPHHWNQAILLETRQVLDMALLERAVHQLLLHHDMLRTRFKQDKDGWQQYNIDEEKTGIVIQVDLSSLSEAQRRQAMQEKSRELHTSLHLVEGPLIRVALLKMGHDRADRLLLIVHHLVVDHVSWLLLLEDLQIAYQQISSGQAIELPPKTTSFQYWSEHLTVYAQSAALQQELPFWLAESRIDVSRLPVDYPDGINTIASTHTLSVSLKREETQALLQDIPQIYQTHINEVLLTALGMSFIRWTRGPTLLIDLEGHGREEIVEGIDLSRTVGWFTTLFPVLLQLDQAAHPADILKAVKEQLRMIPNRGMGYGLLRYLNQETEAPAQLRSRPQAEVCFNYLGQLDQLRSESVLFEPLQESSGPQYSFWDKRHYLLEINGSITSGQLQLNWVYSENLHRRVTVEALAQDFLEALRILIAHCQSPGAGGYTPSDFPQMKLSQQELDHLLIALDESTEGG